MVGYDELAELIGKFPELALFRKFGPLAAKVLLMKQAELLHLQQEFEWMAGHEAKNPATQDLSKSWEKMNTATGLGSRRQRKLNKIQAKLTSYYTLLNHVDRILQLEDARPSNVKFLTDWLGRKDGGNFFLSDAHIEREVWENQHQSDLVALGKRHDRFSRWLEDHTIPFYHQHFGHRTKRPSNTASVGPIWHYENERFSLLGNIICMLLSSILPLSSTFVLYYLKSMVLRLVSITVFSFSFSAIMTFIVQARRQDVFAATAAFAAVQVVFVGGVSRAASP